jgi:hypothetical protein
MLTHLACVLETAVQRIDALTATAPGAPSPIQESETERLQYLRYPRDGGRAYSIVYLLLAIYAMGLTRAWQLLGARRRGLFSWFSPLNDLNEVGPVASAAPDAERKP